jgi:hypothetical protein
MGQVRQRAIEEAAPISEPITSAVEAYYGRDHNIRQRFGAIGGNRNIPNARHEPVAKLPNAKDKWRLFLDNDRQRAPSTAFQDGLH